MKTLLERILLLAQTLDEKGLKKEADVLDKFAATLDEEKMFGGNLLSEKELSDSRRVQNSESMTPELYMDMFRELFMHNMIENHLGMNEAAAAAVREINALSESIEASGEPTEEDREKASQLFQNIIDQED
tara:strand:- start:454 stop:846 length:393 start_codon:yes stop_codon:yes gene_type:complete